MPQRALETPASGRPAHGVGWLIRLQQTCVVPMACTGLAPLIDLNDKELMLFNFFPEMAGVAEFLA